MTLETTRSAGDLDRVARDTDAPELAAAAYTQLVALLEQLEPDEWRAPTVCRAWNVADLVGHVIGAARSCASVPELVRQQWWGRRHADEFDGNGLDATNALQVREHAHLSPQQRLARLRALAPAAVRGRMRLPSPLRRARLPIAPQGSTAAGMPTHFALGRLMDVIYTRDVWMHTLDVARATGRPRPQAPTLDRRIVEDVVREWMERHGAPLLLTLTGAVELRVTNGAATQQLELDALDFCWVLSGRADVGGAADGRTPVSLQATPVEAAGLLRTRLLF
ncbi:maleylpyruvate isomerase family mycothiol-dependent enzyme [Egicoccus sp. AB-alg2]|uniref:maleylpyruvate isomerase family mycothiol-dependent enzyme n=1 Tax=Egicoccus sp. AB-alg2 TaxID=3242693 RepID=UPI00359D1952